MTYRMGVGYDTLVQQQINDRGEHAWTASHPELRGCVATGSKADDAVERLSESREAWLAVAQKRGIEIPAPKEMPAIAKIYATTTVPTTGTEAQESDLVAKSVCFG